MTASAGSGPMAGLGGLLSRSLAGSLAVWLPQTTPASPSCLWDTLAWEPAAETQRSPLQGEPCPAQLPSCSTGQSKFLPRPPHCSDASVPREQEASSCRGGGSGLGSDPSPGGTGPLSAPRPEDSCLACVPTGVVSCTPGRRAPWLSPGSQMPWGGLRMAGPGSPHTCRRQVSVAPALGQA